MEHHQEEENVSDMERLQRENFQDGEMECNSARGSHSQAFANSSSKSNSQERDKLVLNKGCELY